VKAVKAVKAARTARTAGMSVVCWSLVVAPCWAYVARTRVVSLSARALEADLTLRRAAVYACHGGHGGGLCITSRGDWHEAVDDVRRAVARRAEAHAVRAVALIARRTRHRALPRDVWMLIAGFLVAMCGPPAPRAPRAPRAPSSGQRRSLQSQGA